MKPSRKTCRSSAVRSCGSIFVGGGATLVAAGAVGRPAAGPVVGCAANVAPVAKTAAATSDVAKIFLNCIVFKPFQFVLYLRMPRATLRLAHPNRSSDT